MQESFPMRINKYLARGGYATRRSADRLIEEGRVFVNGKVASLGQKVLESDVVEIQNFDTSSFRYLLYYKPAGITTFASTPEEQDIAKELLTSHGITGLFPIGRLDKDTEGLILLTNDGRLTSKILEVPEDQTYEVYVDKPVTPSILNNLKRGVKIEKHIARASAVSALKGDNGFSISLQEHKKFNVRSICAALGLKVIALKRTGIHNFSLKNLKSGEFYELKPKEIKALYKTFSLK